MTLSGSVVPVPFGQAGIWHQRGENLLVFSAGRQTCGVTGEGKSWTAEGALLT